MSAATNWLLACALALLLSGAHLLDSIPDHRAEFDQAADIDAAQAQAQAQARYAAAAQRACGENAAWRQLDAGSVQCFTHRGLKTISAQVQP